MRLAEVHELETELVNGLRQQAKAGDSVAAGVLLQHLRGVKSDISDWQERKEQRTVQSAGVRPDIQQAINKRNAPKPGPRGEPEPY